MDTNSTPPAPSPSELKWWKCNCPEYNTHSIGAKSQCKKCGAKEPSPSDGEMEICRKQWRELLHEFAMTYRAESQKSRLKCIHNVLGPIMELVESLAEAEKQRDSYKEDAERMVDQLWTDRNRFTDPEFNCVWEDAADDIKSTIDSLRNSYTPKSHDS